jgi:hypothetical protein
MKTYAARQLETSANVPVRLRKCHAHGLSRIENSVSRLYVDQLRGVITRRPEHRFGSGLKQRGHGLVDCTLVDFGELWPTYENCRASQLETSARVLAWTTASATPTFRTQSRRQFVSWLALFSCFAKAILDDYWTDSVPVRSNGVRDRLRTRSPAGKTSDQSYNEFWKRYRSDIGDAIIAAISGIPISRYRSDIAEAIMNIIALLTAGAHCHRISTTTWASK